MNNRLYCTFTTLDAYEEIANAIKSSYVILFNKILLIQTEGFNRIDTKIKEIINL